MDYINIFIKSVFVDNMFFAFFLGTVNAILTDLTGRHKQVITTADDRQHTVRLLKQSDIFGQ